MTSKVLIASFLVLALLEFCECGGYGGGGEGGHKKIIVHIPIHHKNVHNKKIITKHISYSTIDDGEVVSHGGEGGDAFSHGKVSGSISIGHPHYSHGHGWH